MFDHTRTHRQNSATSNYVDLRPDNVREVQVLIDGTWRTGDLEAYRKDDTGWRGFVRWSEGPGLHHIDWVGEERLRPLMERT